MARKIPVKPYAPKPWAPGTTVEFDGRSGVVWSAGPVPASVWVALDGDTTQMVPVKLPSASRRAGIIPDLALPKMTQEWLRAKRAEGRAA
ncbi:hypothetical protein SEA_EMOTION_51 [Arthrobacter phage Emotion]|uniref:Uncharacterized protein n=1 Tax=Arthrobacter phage Emotion TaxID=3038361 RepID=A0AA49IJZ0_9CAUD|nr:hypothetical protein SEA_EMOTION_51 [Arthrobacter phage Emotion]